MRHIIPFIITTLFALPALAYAPLTPCDIEHADFRQRLADQGNAALLEGKMPMNRLKPPVCNDGIVYDMEGFYAQLEMKIMRNRVFKQFMSMPMVSQGIE